MFGHVAQQVYYPKQPLDDAAPSFRRFAYLAAALTLMACVILLRRAVRGASALATSPRDIKTTTNTAVKTTEEGVGAHGAALETSKQDLLSISVSEGLAACWIVFLILLLPTLGLLDGGDHLCYLTAGKSNPSLKCAAERW